MWETLKLWDRELFVFLNSLGIDRFDAFWMFVTQIETWVPLFVFFSLMIFYYYKGRKGLLVLFFMVLTFGITILFTGLVKDYVARLRPNNVEAFAQVIRILQTPSNYSFFSGHASSSFSITTFVVFSLQNFTKWIYWAYLWPLLFVSSRIFIGVHYPSDILVGACVGVLFAFGFHYLCQKILLMEKRSFRSFYPRKR